MAEPTGGRERVLIVGPRGERTTRWVRPLERAGYAVRAAHPALAGRLDPVAFDIVLLDDAIPVTPARSLLRRLARRAPGARVIVLTAKGLGEVPAWVATAPVEVGRIPQPADPRQLAAALAGMAQSAPAPGGTRSGRGRSSRRGPTSIRVRNQRGKEVAPAVLPATRAKQDFGAVLDRVGRGDVVVVTRHQAPRAVILSWEEYQALAPAAEPDLDALTREFDALLARMQEQEKAGALRAAFDASPDALGVAAVRAAATATGFRSASAGPA
jgi:prevent-host-death family protein